MVLLSELECFSLSCVGNPSFHIENAGQVDSLQLPAWFLKCTVWYCAFSQLRVSAKVCHYTRVLKFYIFFKVDFLGIGVVSTLSKLLQTQNPKYNALRLALTPNPKP